MPDRPNVLFLMTDEHRADVAGFAGDDVVRTPTLDRIAESGTVFTNAYTPAPKCVPARQCLMAGQLPNTCGCTTYGDDLEPEYETFARRFARHGYVTACAGKLHHTGWDQMQGWRKRLGPTPVKRSVGADAVGLADGVVDDYGRGTDGKWSNAKEIKRAAVGDSRVQVQDRRAVEGTEQFLKQYFTSPFYDRDRRNADGEEQPLLLKVSLVQPHYPFFTDEERFTHYLNRVEPFPDEHVPEHPGLHNGQRVEPGVDASEREIRRALAAYYGMVDAVDDLFGRVLDALERYGEDPEDWVIVYTSDHGDMLGEHGVWEKSVFYEGSARVPLVIRWPEQFEPGRVDANVSLCDLYATLCDLADVPAPDDLDSRSLRPLLAGEETDGFEETVSGMGEDVLIKHGDLKYQYYSDGPEVLFDLASDPGETENCVDDPAYTSDVERFRDRREELGYGPGVDPDAATAGYELRS